MRTYFRSEVSQDVDCGLVAFDAVLIYKATRRYNPEDGNRQYRQNARRQEPSNNKH